MEVGRKLREGKESVLRSSGAVERLRLIRIKNAHWIQWQDEDNSSEVAGRALQW